tara:strand:+ start:1900 stop:2406 length:507 start_codon:yes stop_codon:yes gene_type:complete
MVCSCASSKPTASLKQIEALNTLIESQEFNIESDMVYPQVTYATQQVLNSGLLPPGNTAGAINLIGNSNYLKVSGDSISSYLPYFGERQMQVQYGGGDSAIQFDGIMENYSVTKGKNESYLIKFQAKSKFEQFDGIITIFPNMKTEIFLNGNSRFSIRYSGHVIQVSE